MLFKVRNFKGASSADIKLDKITLIAGKNAQGKSSILTAISAIATGNPNPLNVVKKEMSTMVHSGAASGGVQVIHDAENESNIKWPSLEYKVTGIENTISKIAAGIDSLVDMDQKTRIRFISDMMQCDPSLEDLKKEFAKNNLDESLAVKLYGKIQLNGWDTMHGGTKTKGAKLKGVWEYITDAGKYGIRKAESWYPATWEQDLALKTDQDLESEVSKANDWYIAASNAIAISDSEIETLKEKSVNSESLSKDCKLIKDQVDIIEKLIKERRQKIQDSVSDTMPCPSCGAGLVHVSGKLLIPLNTINPGDKNNIESEINNLTTQKNDLLIQYGVKTSLYNESVQAANKLEEINKKDKNLEVGHLEELTKKLERAKQRLKAFQDYKKASETFNSIVVNEKIIAIISPDGLRLKKLQDSIAIINEKLKELSAVAKWKTAEIDSNFDIMYGGMRYGHSIAKSERYRARVLMQLVVCIFDKSKYCLIDDIDELTESVRSGLVRVVLKSGIPAALVSAIDDKVKMPDFSKIGGVSYWVENGTAEEIVQK